MLTRIAIALVMSATPVFAADYSACTDPFLQFVPKEQRIEREMKVQQCQIDVMKRKQDEQRTMDCLFSGNCY
jgi:hypothetical protein